MGSSVIHDEVLLTSEFPIISLSAFCSLVYAFVQLTNIYSVLNSHRPWGYSSDLNKTLCPYRSFFVVVKTVSE